MACTNVFDAFAVPTESLDKGVYLLASYQSIWLNLIQRDEYPSETGLTQTNFTIGRQEPATDEETWSAITLATGENEGACDASWNDVDFGYTARTYSPERLQLQGPVICKEDLTFDHNPGQFIDKYLRAIAIRAQRSWENRYLKLYMNFSRKGIADTTFSLTDPGATFTQPIATSEITQEMLDLVAQELIQAGATMPDSQGFYSLGEAGPLFSLLIGMEASQHITKNNSEFRNDIRWGYAGEPEDAPLLMRLGASLTIKNFRHIINIFPPRYTYNGTAYVRVNTFESEAATKGTVSDVTAAWKAAPYEAAIVLSPWVFKSRIVRPTNASGSLTWNPTSHMGDWQFVRGAFKWDTDCVDPLEKKGRHFAEMWHAAEQMFPEFGVTIIFKRCPLNSFTQVYCT